MRKYVLLAAVLISFTFFHPELTYAQQGGLTMPGSIPTLAPLGIPISEFGIKQNLSPTPTLAPAPKPVSPASSSKKGSSLGNIVTAYLGKVEAYALIIIKNLKLDENLKKYLIQLFQEALSHLKSYSAKIDPLIRELLIEASKKLPSSLQHFVGSFIPFLTMAGKVILGVVAAVIVIKIFFWLLGKFASSLFRRKRRRR